VKDESKKKLGLERVKNWFYAKDLDERSRGCVLCGSGYGHGPANPMEDVPGPKEKCPPNEFYRFQRHTPKSRWFMAQRVFHGLGPITPELKEIIYSCTTCLMCQELCGVRADRMREAKEIGAELLLTSSALCQRAFTGLKQPALPTQDIIEFVGQAV